MSLAKAKSTYLFIDTNVLLNFYAYSKDDLDQLDKLVKIVKTKSVRLYITQQVVDEFYRNRDSKLSEAFDKFKPNESPGCPRFMVSLPEYKAYSSALQQFRAARSNLIETARIQAAAQTLQADGLFKRLAEEAKIIAVTDVAYAAAERRARLGNPPGKAGSTIGDQLNWEMLLAGVPNGADLHVVSKDGDYASKLNGSEPKVFLSEEWHRAKGGKLHLHEQISLFFKENYPGEDFSLESEKTASIDAVINSMSFSMTHSSIASLMPYVPSLTTDEAQEVLYGALNNSQVRWIADDEDVSLFFKKVLACHGASLPAKLLLELEQAWRARSFVPLEELV